MTINYFCFIPSDSLLKLFIRFIVYINSNLLRHIIQNTCEWPHAIRSNAKSSEEIVTYGKVDIKPQERSQRQHHEMPSHLQSYLRIGIGRLFLGSKHRNSTKP